MTYKCPRDGTELEVEVIHGSRFYTCSTCGGEMVNYAVLRKEPKLAKTARAIWDTSKEILNNEGVVCPECNQRMARVYYKEADVMLDLCQHCHLIWFDRGEYEVLPREEIKPVQPKELSQKSIKALLQAERAINSEILEASATTDRLEQESYPTTQDDPLGQDILPWITWILLAACFAAYIFVFKDPGKNLQLFSFDPENPLRIYGLTWITSFFVQEGYIELFLVLLYLNRFGAVTEKDFGHLRLVMLFIVGHIVGLILLTVFDLGEKGLFTGMIAGLTAVMVHYITVLPKQILEMPLFLKYLGRYLLPANQFATYGLRGYWAVLLWALLHMFFKMLIDVTTKEPYSLLPMFGGALVGYLWGFIVRLKRSDNSMRYQ